MHLFNKSKIFQSFPNGAEMISSQGAPLYLEKSTQIQVTKLLQQYIEQYFTLYYIIFQHIFVFAWF